MLCNKSSICFSSRRLFFLQLLGIVLGMHCAIFATYALVGWLVSGTDRFKISLTQSGGATYVLMPFQKRVDQKNQKVLSGVSNVYKKSNVIDHETYQRKKNAQKKSKIVATAQKSASKKSLKSGTKAAQAAKKPQASVMMQTQSKKQSKLKRSKISAKIQEIVEVEKSEQKLEEKMTVPILSPVPSAATVTQSLQKASAGTVEDSVINEAKNTELEPAVDDDFDENNVIFVGYEELDKSIVGSKIQHSVQQIWTPPAGMSKDVSCEVQIKIGADGQAVQAKVVKPSGVFVYDAAARKTLMALDYPQEVWNKNITIVLGSA
ncbi:hypothetical protein A3J41_02220 [candidate division TM6 bacterium RIFCSPHIGHO2_12_FULL_38_8]|nr:MAG: hypothetical protein A3J41_02220 [candidate division TM6 bacterium RIFCSPHIGHO2_12_FULL_38_8]